MGVIFGLELTRVFNKRNSAILLLMLVLLLYFVNQGVLEYKNISSEKKVFLNFENSKLEGYFSWDQYGAWGFGIFYEPSPLLIFFNNSCSFSNIETNVDTTEIINISTPATGKNLFIKGNSKDFSSLIFILGSLFMLFMGFSNFYSDKMIQRIYGVKNIFKSIFSRIVILDIIFLVICFICLLFGFIRGVTFSYEQALLFFSYCLYLVALLDLFYFAGLLVSAIFKSNRIVVVLVVWILFVFVVPEISKIYLIKQAAQIASREKLNTKKIGVMMGFEKGVRQKLIEKLKKENIGKDEIRDFYKQNVLQFMNDGYILNKNMEAEFTTQVNDLVKDYEKRSILTPITYYNFLAGEMSSKGYHAYLDYVSYITEIRDQFIKFYINNRYNKFGKEIESFIKGEENIYKPESRLPRNFYFGLVLSIAYSLVLFIIFFLVMWRRFRCVPILSEVPKPTYTKGLSHFLLCRDTEYRDNVFRYLVKDDNIVGLDLVTPGDINLGSHPRKSIKMLSLIRGGNEPLALESLQRMGVEEAVLNKAHPSPELLKKIYSAVVFSSGDVIVINDFLRGESKEFEENFFEMLEAYKEQKSIIYLSTGMLSYSRNPEERFTKIESHLGYIEFDFEGASVR